MPVSQPSDVSSHFGATGVQTAYERPSAEANAKSRALELVLMTLPTVVWTVDGGWLV
jgi:hypothetical protein